MRHLSPYLQWLVHQHSTLRLHGIREAGRLPTIELDRVYVALKADPWQVFEREKGRELARLEVEDTLRYSGSADHPDAWEDVQAAHRRSLPYPPGVFADSTLDADLSEGTLTLGDAFRSERWLVIQGGPGSGKTTLVRWLTLNLARALADIWRQGVSCRTVWRQGSHPAD